MKLDDVMKRVVVIYATRYGSTEEIAEQLAGELGIASMKIDDITNKKQLEKFDIFILGTPIYCDDIFEDMKHFIHTFYPDIAAKKFILFTVHGALKEYKGVDYPKAFADYFSKKPLLSLNFYGRATRETMSKKDYMKLWVFYKNALHARLRDFDYMSENDIVSSARRIRDSIIKKS